jgi:hypothetical protein
MYPPSWLKGPATGWRLAALGLGLTVLAGCGSVAAPGSGSSGSGSSGSPAAGSSASPAAGAAAASTSTPKTTASQIPLCASISQITQLTVTRSRGLNRIQELHFPFPPRVIVTNAAAARSVAEAVCALPRMPKGPMPCPMELLGTSYQLTFTAAGRALPLVTAEATGCEQVTGAGPVRRAAFSAAFWQALGRAMDLVAPGPPVFRGQGPTAAQCNTAQTGLERYSGCPAMSGFRK